MFLKKKYFVVYSTRTEVKYHIKHLSKLVYIKKKTGGDEIVTIKY